MTKYVRSIVVCLSLNLGLLFCMLNVKMEFRHSGHSSSWAHGSWSYNYLCIQCLSTLKLWARIKLMASLLDTTLCDKVVRDLLQVSGFLRTLRFPPPIKHDRNDITEILLKVALNTIILTL